MADFTPVAAALKAYIDALVKESVGTTPTPQPEPTPEPVLTLPTASDTDTVYQIVDYTGGNFTRGISLKDNAVLLRTPNAIKLGMNLRFKNSQGSVVTGLAPVTIGDITLCLVSVGAMTLVESVGAPGSVTLYGTATGEPTPTPTPTPEPTPTPTPTPVQYANIRMGMNGHEGRAIYPAGEMEARIKFLAENNLMHYRTDVGAGYLDNTSEFNRLIGLCQKYNVTLRPMIYPVTEDAAYKYAKAYGDRIKVWEIGNEGDIIQDPSARQIYIAGMAATYKGMKRASDELGLGLKFTCNVTATNTRDKANLAYGDVNGATWYFDKVVAAGFKFDYISFHYYPSAFDSQSDWLDFYMTQVAAYFKLTGAKVFLNEYNAGEIYQGVYGDAPANVESLRASLKALQKYKDMIEEITVYQFLDEPAQEGHEAHFGMLAKLGYPKSAFAVVKEYATATVQPATFKRREKGRLGINVGLGAGNDAAIPGIEGTNYTIAKDTELDRMKSYGLDLARIGFLEGRVFPVAADPTKMWQGNDVTQPTWGRVMTLDHLFRIGESAADRGIDVMFDNHGYGYYPSNGASNRALLGSAGNTVDMWVERQFALLTKLKANKKAWSAFKRYDVMNEPYMAEHDAKFLAAAYQKLLDRCAPLTGTELVYVFEGPFYSSMSRWATLVGDAFDSIKHPNGNAYIEFSAHGYPDRGRDGYFDENKDGLINAMDELLAAGDSWETLHLTLAKGFVDWAIAKNRNISVGETIVPGNLTSYMLPAWQRLVRYLLDNGANVYVFGMADGMDVKSEHNIETTSAKSGGVLDNTNTLNTVKGLAKEYNV